MFIPSRPTEDALVALSRLTEEDATRYINSCVHALIVLGQTRNPIKKQDLNRLAFPQSSNYRLIGFVLQQANKILIKTFGMRLYELEDKSKYLLVNAETANEFLEYSDEGRYEAAALFFILLDIFASPDDKVNEDDVCKALKPLDLNKDGVRSILESLVKKLYLQCIKGQETKTFIWGPRAYAEVEPELFFRRFLDFVNETSDKNWPDLRKKVDKLKSLRSV